MASVVPLFQPILVGEATYKKNHFSSHMLQQVMTWSQRTRNRLVVDINISHLGPPPEKKPNPFCQHLERGSALVSSRFWDAMNSHLMKHLAQQNRKKTNGKCFGVCHGERKWRQ
jgi:hypothetical protein